MPTTIQEPKPTAQRFLDAYEAHAGHALNGTHDAVRERRQHAIERFRDLGLPTKKLEKWKYTDISKTFGRDYTIALDAETPALSESDIEPFLIPDLDAHRVVLVNGQFSETLSDIGPLADGVVVTSFANASEAHPDTIAEHFAQHADVEEDALAALNTAFTQDGVFIYVPKSAAVEKPIFILQLATTDEPLLVQPRNLYVAEENAQVQIIEHQATMNEAAVLTNAVTEIVGQKHSNVDHYVLQNEGPEAARVQTTDGYHKGEGVFSTNTITLSGDVVRNNLHLTPDDHHCETHLFGLYLGTGTMHVDNHTLVDHTMPDCFSNELYKGILMDEARGIFNGKVFVHRDAQRINAYQSNKNIVLDKTAEIFSKPELEIYADDVQCSHGSTTGQLDDEALFYLRSRGIGPEKAREMLLHAFARDVLENIRVPALRTYVDALVAERLG